jgi:hypothetical protein
VLFLKTGFTFDDGFTYARKSFAANANDFVIIAIIAKTMHAPQSL